MSSKVDNKNIRIVDIAKRAGVSTGTVDRVLHDRGEVSSKTKDKILKIIEESGYKPNIIASSLAQKKSCSYRVLFPRPVGENSYWIKPVAGVLKAKEELSRYGIQVVLHYYDEFDENSYLDEFRKMMDLDPFAIVIVPAFIEHAAKFAKIASDKGIFLGWFDSYIPDSKFTTYCGLDSYQSGYLAGKLLNFGLSGESTIMVVDIDIDNYNYYHLAQRKKGFVNYFTENVDDVAIVTATVNSYDELDSAIESRLVRFPDIRAIFVTNSRAHLVADILEVKSIDNIILIGYDLIKPNHDYIERSKIDYVIYQHPTAQGYNTLMNIFRATTLKERIDNIIYTPISIITKENLNYIFE